MITRKSTGLVREVGPLPLFFMNMGYNGFLAIPFVLIPGIEAWPSGNLILAAALSWLLFIPHVVIWYWIAKNYPVNGGDYVYASRLEPRIGFPAFFSFVIGEMLYDAVLTYFGVEQLGNGLSILGYQLGSIIEGDAFIIGLIILVLIIIANIISSKIGHVVFMIISILAFISFLLTAALMLGSHIGSLNMSVHGYYSTLGLMAFSTAVWAYVNYPASIGGEVKRGGLSATMGVLAAFIVGGIAFMAFIIGASKGLPLFSDPVSFALSITNNHVIQLIIVIGSSLWYIAPMTGVVIQISRYLLAFSFDGLLPGWVSYVSPRTRSPVLAHLVDLAITASLMYLIVESPFGYVFSSAIDIDGLILLLFTWMAVSLLIMYSAAMGKHRLGINRVALLGLSLLDVIIMSIYAFFWIKYPATYLVPQSPIIILIEACLPFIMGLVIYEAVRRYRLRQGIDISLAFMELPSD
ncbi:MAG: APC family permease [Thermocladium sp.]